MSTLKFTKTHEWLRQAQQDTYTMGITAHAQELLGDMVFIELPDVGREIQQGDSIAVVESVKAASDVYAPISGTVTAVNAALPDNPALLNQDPYEQGWMITIQPSQPQELNTLLDESAYEATLEEH